MSTTRGGSWDEGGGREARCKIQDLCMQCKRASLVRGGYENRVGFEHSF